MEKYKLILVDDEPWALIGLEEIIDWEEEGYTIVARCGSGTEALAAAQFCPDAIVTDIRMPDMTGLQLIAKLRERMPQLQSVVVSAYSDFEVAREAIRLSAVYYAIKPFSAEEVREAASLMRKKIAEVTKEQHMEAPILEFTEDDLLAPPSIVQYCHYLLLADTLLDLPARPKLAKIWQRVRIGEYFGVITDCLPVPLEEQVGLGFLPEGVQDADKFYRMAKASLEGGFRFAEWTESKRSQVQAADIQLYLYEQMEEDITLESLSQHFYLTQTYLCDIFKKQTGETIVGFLRRIRINRAKRLLVRTGMALAEVAQHCGYRDYSYFGRQFKADVGVSPDLYRKRSRQ